MASGSFWDQLGIVLASMLGQFWGPFWGNAWPIYPHSYQQLQGVKYVYV